MYCRFLSISKLVNWVISDPLGHKGFKNRKFSIVIYMLVDFIMRAWCKSGTRNLGTRDPSQSLKVEPGTPLKFKSGTPAPRSKCKSWTLGSPSKSKFKSGTPSPFFNEFIFFRIFHRFFLLFIFVSFVSNTKKYQLRVTEINRQH